MAAAGIQRQRLLWRYARSLVCLFVCLLSLLRAHRKLKVCFSVSGCPDKDCQRHAPTFQGCLRLVVINGQPVNLSHVQQGLLGNFNELKFDTCSIRDR